MGCDKGSCRSRLTIRAHAPLQSKNRAQIKPAVCDVLCPAGGQSNSARKDFANREKLSRLRITSRTFELGRDRTKEDFWNGWRARCRERRAGDGRDGAETGPGGGLCVRPNVIPATSAFSSM